MRSTVHFPQVWVEIEREEIEITSFVTTRVPDPDWRYIDKKGHGHFWRRDKLPTLYERVIGKEWVGDEYDGEEYDITEFRCLECEEVIKPGMKNETPKSVLGPTTVTVTINGETFRVTEDEYARSVVERISASDQEVSGAAA